MKLPGPPRSSGATLVNEAVSSSSKGPKNKGLVHTTDHLSKQSSAKSTELTDRSLATKSEKRRYAAFKYKEYKKKLTARAQQKFHVSADQQTTSNHRAKLDAQAWVKFRLADKALADKSKFELQAARKFHLADKAHEQKSKFDAQAAEKVYLAGKARGFYKSKLEAQASQKFYLADKSNEKQSKFELEAWKNFHRADKISQRKSKLDAQAVQKVRLASNARG